MYVTKRGTLKAEYLPAVYFDSSVLIDYWMTEGLETDRRHSITEIISINEPSPLNVVRELLKSDTRVQKVIEIRRKLVSGQSKLSAVVSPLSLLELMEWNAEAVFKQTASEAVGTQVIQRKSKKEIGDYLKKLLELRVDEVEKQKGGGREYSTGLEILVMDTWLNSAFVKSSGLRGLLQADIVNFKLTIDQTWEEPSAYAYLQLGMADILHILLARHLNCEYIASFDQDFRRVADIVEKETQIKVLTCPENVLDALG